MNYHTSDAEFSPCRTYRYTLTRRWGDGNDMNVIGLNPSTADEMLDDPTIRRCIAFARAWGYSGLVMTNLFAYRSPSPHKLKHVDHIIGPENNRTLFRVACEAKLVVAAWGNGGEYLDRPEHVKSVLKNTGKSISCFGLTQKGNPKHPLYLPAGLEPQPFWVWNE